MNIFSDFSEFDIVLKEMGFTNPILNIAIYNKHDKDHDHMISEKEFVDFVHDHDAIVKSLESNSSSYDKMFNEIDGYF